MARSLSQRINTLDTAIQEIEEGAQAVTVDGFSYTRSSVATLYRQRDKLQKQLDRESGLRPSVKAITLNGLGYG